MAARCNSCGAWTATEDDRKSMRGSGFDYRLGWAVSKSLNTEELICDRCLPHKVHEAEQPNDKPA